MAIRYCGNVTIRLKYRDQGDYRCVVTAPDCRPCVIRVGPPASGFGAGISYDSPEAYDATARAALSFAIADDRLSIEDLVPYSKDDDGFKITRSPRKVTA